MNDSKPEHISPCNGVCQLDDDEICVGCFRTIEEIVLWPTMERASHEMVMEACRRRRVALEAEGKGPQGPIVT